MRHRLKHLFPECDFPKSWLSPCSVHNRCGLPYQGLRSSGANERCGNMEDVTEIPRVGGWQEWSAPQPSYIRAQQTNTHGNVLRSLWLEDRDSQSSIAEWESPGSWSVESSPSFNSPIPSNYGWTSQKQSIESVMCPTKDLGDIG